MPTFTEVDHDPFAPPPDKTGLGAAVTSGNWRAINAAYAEGKPARDAAQLGVLRDELKTEAQPQNVAALNRDIGRVQKTMSANGQAVPAPRKGSTFTEVDHDPFAPAAQKAPAASAAASDNPVMALGAGLGSGVGKTVLGAQKLLGQGLGALGAAGVGEWLVKDADQGRAKLSAEVAPYKEASPLSAGGGELAGEIAATLPVGGALAAPIKALGASRLASAIGSAGFRTGVPVAETFAGKAADQGIRALGGAITGGASAALINQDDAAMGAGLGAMLPGALSGIGKGFGIVRNAMVPQEVRLAGKIADLAGAPAAELRTGLQQEGPSMILGGYQPTVPQIAQNPAISQLQRTMKTAGTGALGEAEKAQQAQYLQTLNSIAPIDGTVQDAADRAGSAIKAYAVPARADASKRVREAFDAIDPNNEAALFLPIEDLQKAKATFLGDGTFGTGTRAQQAIDTANRFGTETVEEVAPYTAKQQQDLVLAVRAAGGINTSSKSGRELSGEIKNLRESGLKNIVRPNTGKSVEKLAEEMHQSGFLPDDDPATLLNLLQESAAGNKVYANSPEDMYRAAFEASQGAPPEAGTFARTVPFQTMQNLRSSIGEAAQQAEMKGANKEAGALKQMVGAIDSRVNRAAGGNVEPGEFFPQDMGDRYRTALGLHADKMKQFETGPQVGMFRQGGDGQAAIQGAEIPGKFYSGRRSQVEDMQAFKRLIGDSPGLTDEMKRYALTEATATANQAGDLTSKFNKFLDSRSGANRELFAPGEQATIGEVGKAVANATNAENLGRVSGSDTAQKIASLNSLGLLDNRVVDILANRIPVIGSFTGPALSGLRATAAQDRNNAIARLLASPEVMAAALQKTERKPGAISGLLRGVEPGAYRVGPALISD